MDSQAQVKGPNHQPQQASPARQLAVWSIKVALPASLDDNKGAGGAYIASIGEAGIREVYESSVLNAARRLLKLKIEGKAVPTLFEVVAEIEGILKKLNGGFPQVTLEERKGIVTDAFLRAKNEAVAARRLVETAPEIADEIIAYISIEPAKGVLYEANPHLDLESVAKQFGEEPLAEKTTLIAALEYSAESIEEKWGNHIGAEEYLGVAARLREFAGRIKEFDELPKKEGEEGGAGGDGGKPAGIANAQPLAEEAQKSVAAAVEEENTRVAVAAAVEEKTPVEIAAAVEKKVPTLAEVKEEVAKFLKSGGNELLGKLEKLSYGTEYTYALRRLKDELRNFSNSRESRLGENAENLLHVLKRFNAMLEQAASEWINAETIKEKGYEGTKELPLFAGKLEAALAPA